VHIDVEDDADALTPQPGPLPERMEIAATIETLLGDAIRPSRLQIHYLGSRMEIEVILTRPAWDKIDPDALKRRTDSLLQSQSQYRSITFFVQHAP